MDFEKLTDRARGFLQAAQTIAVREHHQRIAPAHLGHVVVVPAAAQPPGFNTAERVGMLGTADHHRSLIVSVTGGVWVAAG